MVDAADWPAHQIEYWCNAACFEAGIPYIAMGHFPPIARVGPLYVPGQTGCFACQDIRYRREYPLYDVAIEQRQAKPSPAATFGPACGLIGGVAGTEVVHFLTGLITPAMLGAGYIFDLRTMEVERYEVDARARVLGLRESAAGGGAMNGPAENPEVSAQADLRRLRPCLRRFQPRGYMYERWTGRLLQKAEEAGLQGERLLDVAAGPVSVSSRCWSGAGR